MDTKATSLFLIPLAGDANNHIENFERLEALIGTSPGAILFKLVGSGGIFADAALTYLDIMSALPADVPRATISYSPMLTADFALWLGIAPLRDIRPSAWVQVYFPEDQASIDPTAQRCFDIIDAHTSLELFKNRVVPVSELRDLLLIDTPFTESLDCGITTDVTRRFSR